MIRTIVISTVTAVMLIATPAIAQHRGGASTGHAAAPRAGGAPRTPSGTVVGTAAPRRPAGGGVAPGRVSVAAYGVYWPYYTFRPQLNLGFGLWAGYPVAYPYFSLDPYYPSYYSSYPYGPTYPYGYDPYPVATPGYPVLPPSPGAGAGGMPPGLAVGMQPEMSSGGLSFDITPTSAQVYVDGTNVGPVSDFGLRSQPLAVAAGRHHVEVQAAGYQTLAFDAEVTAGQVTPYQGTLQLEPPH